MSGDLTVVSDRREGDGLDRFAVGSALFVCSQLVSGLIDYCSQRQIIRNP
jgi:hypothetical protein